MASKRKAADPERPPGTLHRFFRPGEAPTPSLDGEKEEEGADVRFVSGLF